MEFCEFGERAGFVVGDRYGDRAAIVGAPHHFHHVRRLAALRTGDDERTIEAKRGIVYRNDAGRARRDGQSQNAFGKVFKVHHRVVGSAARHRVGVECALCRLCDLIENARVFRGERL